MAGANRKCSGLALIILCFVGFGSKHFLLPAIPTANFPHPFVLWAERRSIQRTQTRGFGTQGASWLATLCVSERDVLEFECATRSPKISRDASAFLRLDHTLNETPYFSRCVYLCLLHESRLDLVYST